MAAFRFTPDAVADRDDIWRFIASDNRAAADRVEEAICRLRSSGREPVSGPRPVTLLPVAWW